MIIEFRLNAQIESTFWKNQRIPSKSRINDKRVEKFECAGRDYEIDWRSYFVMLFFFFLESTQNNLLKLFVKRLKQWLNELR